MGGAQATRVAQVGPARVVLDTNVLVSALLSPGRTASHVLDLLPTGDLTVLLDDRIVAEYWDVLTRPHFPFDPADAAQLIRGIIGRGEFVAPRSLPTALPDPDDMAFAEVALAGRADALVTGNARHFAPIRGLLRVRTPRELLAELGRDTKTR